MGVSNSHTQSNFSIPQTFQSFCKLHLFQMCTSSLRFLPVSSEETSSLDSSENGKTMTWQDIRHQLADLHTTSVHHRVFMTFKRTQFTQSFTPSSFSAHAPSSQEFGSMYQDQAQEMLPDNLWTKTLSLKDLEKTPW